MLNGISSRNIRVRFCSRNLLYFMMCTCHLNILQTVSTQTHTPVLVSKSWQTHQHYTIYRTKISWEMAEQCCFNVFKKPAQCSRSLLHFNTFMCVVRNFHKRSPTKTDPIISMWKVNKLSSKTQFTEQKYIEKWPSSVGFPYLRSPLTAKKPMYIIVM